MAMLPFAFSIHNFISSVGADAGFAAIVGLAVLVLLYFAHARETANLREEAALLTQRLQQAEARVVQLTRGQPAAAEAAVNAVPTPAGAAFAPAFTAAPALGSATKVIAAGAEPELAPPEVEPVPAAAPAMAMAGVAAAPVESSAPAPTASPAAPTPRPPAQATAPPAPTPGAPAPAPSPPAGLVPAPATNAGGNGASQRSGPPAPVPGEPERLARPVASARPVPSRQLPPLQLPRRRQRSRIGRGVSVALAALLAVVAAVVLFAVTSVGASKHSPNTSTTNSPGSSQGQAAFKPSSVTVAVLNGTAVNQLAHRIGAKLAARGYRTGTIATAANQTETTTVVAYLSGKGDHSDALHVARALGLSRSALRPVDQSTLQVACPTSSACPANVVVTVGSDLAGQ
jgi:hypothetical protein